MKLSNKTLVNSASVLSKLNCMELSIKVSYALMKNIERIEKELKTFDALRIKIIERYSLKDEYGKTLVDDGGLMSIENPKQYNIELNELLDIEVDIDIHQIDVELLLKCEECNLSPSELKAIEYMIKEN